MHKYTDFLLKRLEQLEKIEDSTIRNLLLRVHQEYMTQYLESQKELSMFHSQITTPKKETTKKKSNN